MTLRTLTWKLSLFLVLSACSAEGPEAPQLSSSTRAVVALCAHQPNGTPCGTDCTEQGMCHGGVCVGAVAVVDGTPCRSPEFCMANTACQSGSCVGGTPVAAGTPCQTGNICTLDDHCDGTGACVAGNEIDCDDGIPGTTDFCDPKAGCVHSTSRAAETLGHYEGGVGSCSFAGTQPVAGSALTALMFSLVALLALARRRRSRS